VLKNITFLAFQWRKIDKNKHYSRRKAKRKILAGSVQGVLKEDAKIFRYGNN
jgi:hypothetical protein